MPWFRVHFLGQETSPTLTISAAMFKRLNALARAAARGLCVSTICTAALAQSYPANPIHWIVPFPAGSGTDVMTRALATATKERLPALPDVPTFDEAGMPDFNIASWMAVMVPAGTPAEIVARLSREIGKAVNSPELSKFYANLNMLPATNTPEEFARLIRSESATWGPLIKSLGISLE